MEWNSRTFEQTRNHGMCVLCMLKFKFFNKLVLKWDIASRKLIKIILINFHRRLLNVIYKIAGAAAVYRFISIYYIGRYWTMNCYMQKVNRCLIERHIRILMSFYL